MRNEQTARARKAVAKPAVAGPEEIEPPKGFRDEPTARGTGTLTM
jgi:hypothetical protein